MTSHGHSFATYADTYSRMKLTDAKYLGFRDMPQLFRRYAKGYVALDYGCGPAVSTAFLRQFGFLVDGVDINENMIRIAGQQLPDIDFQLVQDGRIPAEDEHYDLVFCSWVLQDIGSKEKLVATLSEIARVLKAGAPFMAIVPSEAFFGRDWSHANAEFEENRGLKGGDRAKVLFKENGFVIYPYFWTDDDYRQVLREAGLEVVLVHLPLGRDDDGFAWVNEKEVAMFAVYVATKNESYPRLIQNSKD